jgi:hypothetical protein
MATGARVHGKPEVCAIGDDGAATVIGPVDRDDEVV